MTMSACSARLAMSSDVAASTAIICDSAVVHGNSGAEPADDLSVRFARPIQGARYLNRATRLALLAVDQLGLLRTASHARAEQLGVVAATFGAHFEHSRGQITELLTRERPLVSPMLGPNSIPSSVSSCLSIYLDAQAFTLTFCDCGTAGIEALAFAARAVASGRARSVVVVGVESRPVDLERALFGHASGAPPDEAYAILFVDHETWSSCCSGRMLSVVAQARRFSGAHDVDARRVALRRCFLQVVERARKLDVPVDLLLGNMRQLALDVTPNDLFTLAPGWRDAHWLDDCRCHPGLQCTAGLAHVAALHELSRTGKSPEALVTLRCGSRALDQLRGAIIVNAASDGTIACTLLSSDAGPTP
jgi:hypothetical protein